MTNSELREIEALRDELNSIDSRIRRLEIRAGLDIGGTIPQQRLEELVDAATGKRLSA